ncbi:hypothetical protein G8E10_24845 [Rhizobiaceae bacterium CRRU44]|uniref:Uncharacterized protein n=1 Tax=Ferranicluibacter rubi TaxID=2715133 RepID=A0AA43ZM17_9HYPH|nr:hypothetical protein [Ferranicluibacter rubi]NHT78931.1 hypothetical protein [Ferranicluibacter rubi]
MEITSPKIAADHPDYQISCEEALDLPARDLVDKAIQAGWSPRVIYKALQEVARNQALAYEEDPDPEDDPA